MTHPRLLAALTAANFALLAYLVAQVGPAAAGDAPVLRGRQLELIDGQGRVRASLHVEPAGRGKDGQAYPETVILRLIDANGQPSVKLTTSETGAGLSLVGGDDQSYAVLQAGLQTSSLKLTNQAGKQQVLQP